MHPPLIYHFISTLTVGKLELKTQRNSEVHNLEFVKSSAFSNMLARFSRIMELIQYGFLVSLWIFLGDVFLNFRSFSGGGGDAKNPEFAHFRAVYLVTQINILILYGYMV